MPRVAIALGSNLGNRQENIVAAIAELRKISCSNEAFLVASLHDTEPLNCPPNSPRFLNTVIDLHYKGDNPLELLALTKSIEKKLGREPNPIRNAPRTIDIDLLHFGDTILNHPDLILPHPRIQERPFVLNPLKEIRPSYA
jgi:2-amino-4-hydroxy-6-hydroxymethyldihydropteridine diphosphokinase